jgi:ABC-type nitrate/sulfonate/bicarbonate transport system substrate-binding protein
MTMQRKAFVRGAALALAAVASDMRRAAAQELHAVRVLEVPADGAKSVLYAQKMNLFAKRGINADILSLGSGSAIFAAVLGGAADFGSGSLWPVFQAFARGLPLRIIAPASIYQSNKPDAFLLVRKDSSIAHPRDLNGKIVGGDAANDIAMVATRTWLDQHGGDGKTLKTVDLNSAAQLASLEAGRIDAAVLKPPFLTKAMESGNFRQIGTPYDAVGPRFLLSCWVATADYIAKNTDIVNGFVAGLTEAAKITNANQNSTIEMVAAFTKQDPVQLAKGLRSTTAVTISLAEMQRPLDFAYKNGIIQNHFDLSSVLAASVPLTRGNGR